VPEGEFKMGSIVTDKDSYNNERPQHTVFLDSFWIDSTEITNSMFANFVQTTGYKTEAEKLGSGYTLDLNSLSWVNTKGADWRHPRGPSSDINGLDDHPVVLMGWNDARAYCTWTNRALPSEAQWEKAARGTDGLKYPWGNQSPAGNLLNFADQSLAVNWAEKSVNDGYLYTAPVGHYPMGASPYGALDMAGNVWEWVADGFNETYYSNSPGKNPTGPDSGMIHVLRGGAWNDKARDVRASIRNSDPGFTSSFGFRCVATLTP
jgi:formylglycine-generating enzyme required for sulfatase activity